MYLNIAFGNACTHAVGIPLKGSISTMAVVAFVSASVGPTSERSMLIWVRVHPQNTCLIDATMTAHIRRTTARGSRKFSNKTTLVVIALSPGKVKHIRLQIGAALLASDIQL